MDLHDRVMQVLDGRIRMGAGGKKKKPGPKKAPVRKAAPKKKPSKKGGIHAGIQAGIMAGGKKKKVAAGRKAAKSSDWVKYVKEWAKLNKVTYGEAMCAAGPSYKAWKNGQ